MRIKVIIYSIILLCCSCTQRKESDPILRFTRVIEIESQRLPVNTYKLNSFGKLLLFEEQQCVIKKNQLSESLLDIIFYMKDSIASFAQLGNGPNEYLSPYLMQKINQSKVNILELQKKEVETKDLSGNRLSLVKLDRMPLMALQTKNGYVVSGLLDRDQTDDKRYALLDKKGKYMFSFGEFPSAPNESGHIKSKVLAYQDYMVYNDSLDRFATVTSSGAIFELYQLGETPLLLTQHQDVLPKYKEDSGGTYTSITHEKNNMIGFVDLYSTEQYIYALYSGKQLNTKDNNGMLEAMQSRSIFVYDWNGNCICLLKTDVPLFNISVTDDDKQIIGLGWEDDYQLYKMEFAIVY